MLHVQLSVELVAKIGFAALLYPRAILASTRLRFLTTRLICLRMPGIRGDKSRILSNSLFYLQAKSIELSLEFCPDRSILTGLRQPLSEIPYGRKIRNVLWESEKVHEREPIHRLPLEFWIGEPVPLLEHEQLDHYHLIDVWSSASFAPVIVHITHDRAKRSPIYLRFNLRQPIAKLFHSLVRLLLPEAY